MTQGWLAFWFFVISAVVMWLGYMIPRARTMLVSIGFFVLASASFNGFSNWLPQVEGLPPPPPLRCEDPKVKAAHPEECNKNVMTMSVAERADMGEEVIFGKVGGFAERGIGKGQCPLCHTFKQGDIGDRAPNLVGITSRAGTQIKDPRYLKPDTVQTESFPGSGRATAAAEYIAESHACPDCFVVVGFGEKGTNDRNSPMPEIHKPPISLSIDELIAVDTWLFVNEGVDPPSPEEIRTAYEKFIPESARPKLVTETAAAGDPCVKFACPKDSPEQIVTKMACAACHKIPDIDFAKTGAIGPLLIEGANAPNRIKSPEYQAAIQAGKAHATTPKEYVIESIMDPSAFIVQGFEVMSPGGKSLMPADFATKFTYAAVSNMADFLLTQTAEKAIKAGVDRHPMEKDGSLLKKAELNAPPTRAVDGAAGSGSTAVLAQR